MVSAIKGTLLETSDAATKQLILFIAATNPDGEQGAAESGDFVLQDLDETHVLVKADAVEHLLREVERFDAAALSGRKVRVKQR